MTDEQKALVERLRSQKDYRVVGFTPVTTVNPLCAEAAEAIEAQAREIKRLREALRKLSPMVDWMPHPDCVTAARIIDAALAGKDEQ